jgi:site-specific DNA-methyltransferase (adenine-specific)/adenine-specific DNA-methyltransferase
MKEYRGKVDLIFIDPPTDSAADYVKRVQLRCAALQGEGKSLLEEN